MAVLQNWKSYTGQLGQYKFYEAMAGQNRCHIFQALEATGLELYALDINGYVSYIHIHKSWEFYEFCWKMCMFL
jgi:hypothetical protein